LAIELSRKSVAKILGANPAEIFFTSGGTESSNTAIFSAVRNLGCVNIITSLIEHHAVLHTVDCLKNNNEVTVQYVDLLPDGHINLQHFEHLLSVATGKTLVTLMHANNEIGNMIDLKKVPDDLSVQATVVVGLYGAAIKKQLYC
jgi:cysteine desulfurase